MFKKVLIANRGEIALRIIRACKELSIRTLAIHSEVDAATLFVKNADEACLVGPGPIEGYLNIYRIIDLAKQKGADAIHPGYGFLAENAEFAQACQDNNLTFIGPSSKVIRMMGDKISARAAMKQAGVPIVPGLMEPIQSLTDARKFADEIGYPVMLKASAGGGGRGLRICNNREELNKFFQIVRSEAKIAFGKDAVFMEKFIRSPHHIEIQVLADKMGNITHLGERDCSIQRRHQKLIEIAPSLLLDETLREEMGRMAVRAARAVNYDSAGTVEFLVDSDRNFYFLEMNTRIQVEHTVTEEVTGIDIVKEMIRVAGGKRLTQLQDEIFLRGYAIECRINAEDPQRQFVPTPGEITSYYSPGGFGIRIDGNIFKGYVVPPYYDSLLAKVTVRAMSWSGAVQRMQRALDEYVIRGVKTTIPFLKQVLKDPDFEEGRFDTSYLETHLEKLNIASAENGMDKIIAIAAVIAAHSRKETRPLGKERRKNPMGI
ncbi:MAG: acetyl-CoA carboxylase biotin carboxylase subunit [Nitrospiria bacterium]